MLDMSSLLGSLQSGPTDCYDYLAPNTTADTIDQTIPRYDPSFVTYEDYTTYAFAYMNSYLPWNLNKKWSNGLTMALRLALDYYGAGITSTFALNSDILSKYLANYTVVDTFTKVVDSFNSSSYNRDYQWYDMNLYSMIMKSGSKYLAVACTCTNDTTKVL